MTENASQPVKLSAHDTRLLSAAIAYTLGVIGVGEDSADFVNDLADTSPREYKMLSGARSMLARSKEGMTDDSPAPSSAETFIDNLERLYALGILFTADSQTEAELEAVQAATDIDKDGNEVGAKRYALWLTHDEIHLIHWALMAAEAVKDANSLSEMQGATEAYVGLRTDVVDELKFDNFVTKFDNVHRQARIDDGEEVGVKSTPATPA